MKSSYLKTILYTATTTALLLGSSHNYAQQYYKWVDANGSTHYTATPPPKGAKRLDKVSTYGSNIQRPPVQTQPEQGDAKQVNNPPPVNTTTVAPAACSSAPKGDAPPPPAPPAANSNY